jgi:hypothetical protein
MCFSGKLTYGDDNQKIKILKYANHVTVRKFKALLELIGFAENTALAPLPITNRKSKVVGLDAF